MLQAVPLRAALRIDIDLIIQRTETQGCQIHDLLLERLTAETRELDVLKTPVQLDVLARGDLTAGFSDDVFSQEVESWI